MPRELTPDDLTALDPNFKDRALDLTRNAMKGVTKSKGTVALKQWWNDADFKTLAAETTLKLGTGVASGFAIGAVAAAGVAASAVTFGVAPALGLVVGLAVSKGLKEYHYQSASNDLRRALKKGGGIERNILPLEKLPEAIEKVIKKYIRVARRGKMLVGGARGVAYNLRHLNTTLRSAWNRNDTVQGDNLTTKFASDNELKKRLLEFRYYAQMVYNTVSEHLDRMVAQRNTHLENTQLYYAHILRQVHFTGKHENCGTFSCYNISASDFRTAARGLALTAKQGNFLTSGYHARADASAVQARAVAMQQQQALDRYVTASNVPVAAMNSGHFKTMAQNTPQEPPASNKVSEAHRAKEEAIEQTFTTVLPGVVGDMGTGAADTAGGGISNWGSSAVSGQTNSVTFTSFHSTNTATSNVGSVPFAATVGAGVGVGLDLTISFGIERYKRRAVRSKVLGAQKAIEELLDGSHAAAAHEIKEFAKLEKEDMARISEKIIWYVSKVNDLESDQTFRNMQAHIGSDRTFAVSKFATCDDAYNLWYTVNYIIRQYGKMIANLVCMEVMLLKLDAKLVQMDIGVIPGTLVAEGKGAHARPAHMKDIDD